ncbi:uncharacterized protein A4U43_C01F32570 [Asparagus officinalis]|uniref:Uncharacterized protein n=1 Tax=Asparagus officinalis TaxID=4686 RepID=A0A5P1FW23_ASPOF|nr:uncharacterized protein A4U43_C01F32570 [Asparagus officinalis]
MFSIIMAQADNDRRQARDPRAMLPEVVLSRSVLGWGPHAYFSALADTRSNDESIPTTTNHFTVNSTPMEMDTVSIPSEHQIQYSMRDSSPVLDTMEAGRRY